MEEIIEKNCLLDKLTQRMATLCEVRGAAAFKWKKEIENAIQYVQEKLSNGNFLIVFDLGKYVDFLYNCKCSISVTNGVPEKNKNKIYGYFRCSTATGIFNGKLGNTSIELFCLCDKNKKIIKETIIPQMFHELNHAYHCFIRYSNNFGSQYSDDAVKEIDGDEDVAFKQNDIITFIFYSLFCETEMNAYVATFYGELKAKNIDRYNFNKKLPSTELIVDIK